MDVDTAELLTSLLALVALGGSIVLLGVRVLGRTSRTGRAIGGAVANAALWLAFAVAAVATAGSLYFSEVANYVPCRLCWFQRIAMYPLAVVLLVAAIRNDRAVRWYVAPLAVIGAAISSYHYLLEWKPELEGDACGIGPACAVPWFRELGFVTLAFMAFCGFFAILVLIFFFQPRTDSPEEA